MHEEEMLAIHYTNSSSIPPVVEVKAAVCSKTGLPRSSTKSDKISVPCDILVEGSTVLIKLLDW